jgi:peptidoglycan/LPS O-acetylase OafA/YrhL
VYTAPQPEKLDYLLGLRGLAALGVVLGHGFAIGAYSLGVYISSSPSPFFALIDHPLDPIRTALFTVTPILGTNFVILFFVQSGYLMGKVFHDRKYDLSLASIFQFYKNRYFRLAPLLYFNLLVAICFFSNANLSLREFIGDIFFITNFTDRGINLVTWSLSHEMQYYLLAPFVFYLFRRASYAALLSLIGCIGVVYLFTRHGFLSHFEYLYAFLVGYAVNILIRIWPVHVAEKTKVAVIVVGIVLIDILFNWLFLRGFINLSGLIVAALSAGAVFIAECPSPYELSRSHPAFARVVRWGMFTGALSYGIYLWHYMVIVSRFTLFTQLTENFSVRLGRQELWEKIFIYHVIELSFTIAVTYLLATITFNLIEVRFRPGLYRPASASESIGTGATEAGS